MSETVAGRPAASTIGTMIWISMALGASYWVLDAFLDSFVFHGPTFKASLIAPDSMCLTMRVINWMLITGFAVLAQVMLQKRKAVEDVLKQERDRAQRYLDISPVIMLVLDKDGKVLLLNRAGCTILADEERDVVGRNWFDEFVPDRERDWARARFARSFQSEWNFSHYSEGSVRTRLGGERLIAWRTALITDRSGAGTGLLFAGADITELKVVEQEREKLIKELQDAVAEVRALGSLLPICAGCKKIRDDKGYWHQVEVYIGKRSGTRFTHGMCPDCVAQYYGDLSRFVCTGDDIKTD